LKAMGPPVLNLLVREVSGTAAPLLLIAMVCTMANLIGSSTVARRATSILSPMPPPSQTQIGSTCFQHGAFIIASTQTRLIHLPRHPASPCSVVRFITTVSCNSVLFFPGSRHVNGLPFDLSMSMIIADAMTREAPEELVSVSL
jgi:hypothetical protein